MDSHELAWAAGFYDGEGSTFLQANKQGRTYIQMSITQNERRVLDRFQRAVGVGKVYGPYENRTPYYWRASSRKDVETAMDSIWPWLSETKREQLYKYTTVDSADDADYTFTLSAHFRG